MPMPRPLGITLDKPNAVLIIQWADGAICRYPLSHLREACPCAECRGGHHNMGRQGDPEHILALTPAPPRINRAHRAGRQLRLAALLGR